MAIVTQPGTNVWLADSGASHHTSCNISNYSTFERIDKPYKIQQLQGEVLVTHWGIVQLVTQSSTGPRNLILSEVLYIPTMDFNLLSLKNIIKANCIPMFGEIQDKCIIKKILQHGKQEQIALMDITNGRLTLECDMAPRTPGTLPSTSTQHRHLPALLQSTQRIHRQLKLQASTSASST